MMRPCLLVLGCIMTFPLAALAEKGAAAQTDVLDSAATEAAPTAGQQADEGATTLYPSDSAAERTLTTRGTMVSVLTMEDALRAADERNPDLAVARDRLTAAREGSRQAWSAYLPQVSAGGSYNYNSTEASIAFPAGFYVRDVIFEVGPEYNPDFDEDEPLSDENMPGFPTSYVVVPAAMIEAQVQRRHQLGGQVQVRQALIAPPLWPAIRAAYLGEEIAELSVESARREILFAVASIYYGAIGLREAVDLQERMLEVVMAHERDATLRVVQGTAPRVALLRARIERTQAEQDLLRTRNAYLGLLSSLASLLDTEPDFDVERPSSPQTVAEDDDLEAIALEERPDVVAARLSVNLSEELHRSALYRYLPMLGLTATYQVSNVKGFTGEYGNWIAGLGLSWNIFDGGLRESELRQASARISESRNQARATQARIMDEIRRARLDLDNARASLVKAEERALLAAENVQLIRGAYEAGVATSLEMVDANAALRGAELARINEQLNAELAALALARAAGLFNVPSR